MEQLYYKDYLGIFRYKKNHKNIKVGNYKIKNNKNKTNGKSF